MYTPTFKAYSAKVAQFLVRRGFTVLSVRPNLSNLKLNVWLFEDTPELRTAFAQYCDIKNKGRGE